MIHNKCMNGLFINAQYKFILNMILFMRLRYTGEKHSTS